ncbi:hypothetical protein L209DRAFT_745450 [Thermothelomyces heterothallicus CBS 203.75]
MAASKSIGRAADKQRPEQGLGEEAGVRNHDSSGDRDLASRVSTLRYLYLFRSTVVPRNCRVHYANAVHYNYGKHRTVTEYLREMLGICTYGGPTPFYARTNTSMATLSIIIIIIIIITPIFRGGEEGIREVHACTLQSLLIAKDKLAKRSLLTGEITMCPPPATIPVRGGSAQRPYLRESSTSIHHLRLACFFFFGARHHAVSAQLSVQNLVGDGSGPCDDGRALQMLNQPGDETGQKPAQLVATVAQPPRECKDAMPLRWWWRKRRELPVPHPRVRLYLCTIFARPKTFGRSPNQTRKRPGSGPPADTPWQSVKESKCHHPFARVSRASKPEETFDGETNAMWDQEGADKVGDASSSHVALQSAGVA